MSLLSDDTERFWTADVSTGIHYQINSESALTWHQARKSCQQQNAELLSITETQEQAYIGGKKIENKTLKYDEVAALSPVSVKKEDNVSAATKRRMVWTALPLPGAFLWSIAHKPLWEWNVPTPAEGSSCSSCTLSQGKGFLCSPLCKGAHSWPELQAGPLIYLFHCVSRIINIFNSTYDDG